MTFCGVWLCLVNGRPPTRVLVVMTMSRRIVALAVAPRSGWRRCAKFQSSDWSPTAPAISARIISPGTDSTRQANLRILDVEVIKTVPYVPLSHPFVERLIGTIRRECLDRTLFWTAADLDVKLHDFQRYFNGHRTHAGLGGPTREPRTGEDSARANVSTYRWQPHCRGLYQTPMAA